jgi:hypothetical protein
VPSATCIAGRVSLTTIAYPEIKLDPKLPVVNFGTKSRPSYYPAEVCVIEPGQPTRIKDTDLKDMSRFTIRPPQDTLSTVRQGPKLLGFGEKSSNVFDVSASSLELAAGV